MLRCVWEMTDSELLKPTEFYNCHTTHSKAYRGVLALMQKKIKAILASASQVAFFPQSVGILFIPVGYSKTVQKVIGTTKISRN